MKTAEIAMFEAVTMLSGDANEQIRQDFIVLRDQLANE